MRILFDKSAPHGLARSLEGHIIATAESRGCGRLENGALLKASFFYVRERQSILADGPIVVFIGQVSARLHMPTTPIQTHH